MDGWREGVSNATLCYVGAWESPRSLPLYEILPYNVCTHTHTHTLIFWESEAKQKWLNFFVFMGDPLQVLLIMKLDLLSFFLRF